MAKVTPLSGFPEWQPHERIAEQLVLAQLKKTFELHGFVPIETRSVEPLDQLLRKGETDKEIYLLRRLQADDGEPDAGLGLHFDLTVPFARYVLERAGKLEFPLRRYQIQKAWRGERPQEGRYREFLQADIDVVDRDTLPFHYEVELPLVMAEALAALPLPPVKVLLNNRKVPEGFYRGLGIDDATTVLRTVDKLAKIGPAKVKALLKQEGGCDDKQADGALALAAITSTDDESFVDQVRALGSKHPLLDEGLDELVRVVAAGRAHAPGLFAVDLSVARGLDYYTGTVYETQLVGHEDLGSVCSGGRYDALATDGTTTYPGVGLSFGVTRVLGRLFGRELLGVTRKVPSCVLVALADDESRPASEAVARALRGRGIPALVAPEAAKYGKQIRFADRRGIPYVWFPTAESGHEIRDIRTGDQTAADPANWEPPAQDRWPTLTTDTSKESPA